MHPKDGRVVSNFIVQALRGEPIPVYGDGSQTRSFCYVNNLIGGFVRFMKSPEELTGPINLGNPAEFTIKELADTVLQLTGSKSKVVYRPLPNDDSRQRQPDIRLAKQALVLEPKVTLREGIVRTLDYFEQILTASQQPTTKVYPYLERAEIAQGKRDSHGA